MWITLSCIDPYSKYQDEYGNQYTMYDDYVESAGDWNKYRFVTIDNSMDIKIDDSTPIK